VIELVRQYEEHCSTCSRSSSKRKWCSQFSHLMLLATMVRIDHHAGKHTEFHNQHKSQTI